MMTPAFHELFMASAGVAGALIGLLFVAVSIEHERLTAEEADQVHRVRASAALTSFTNALVISLFALIPGVGVGWTAFVVSLTGLLFILAALLSLRRYSDSHSMARRDPLFLVGLLVTFVLQLWFAVRLISRATDIGATRGIAILVVVCFLIGIARSWELIGGPSIGLGGEMLAMFRTRDSDDRSDGAP
jgi:hypothetical protein